VLSNYQWRAEGCARGCDGPGHPGGAHPKREFSEKSVGKSKKMANA